MSFRSLFRTAACATLVAIVLTSSPVVRADTSETGATDRNVTAQSSLSLGTHACVVLGDSSVKCWGNNSFGQLGDGTTTNSSTPVAVTGLDNVATISSSHYHTCALITGGTVKCWGYNNNGQLGDGTTTNSSAPVSVAGLTDVTAIGAGQYHSCALVNTGIVKCWGGNNNGGIGDGTTTNRLAPTTVTGLTGAVAVSVGDLYSCALLGTGSVKCWGRNMDGQLGDGTTVFGVERAPVNVVTSASDLTPLTGVTAISAGGSHVCALLSTGTVKCWGFNRYGTLGNNTEYNKSSTPVDVRTSSSNSSPLTNVTAITAGGWAGDQYHTCALLNDGTIKCWGRNTYGQLGMTSNAIFGLRELTPVTVTGITTAKAVVAGPHYTCAVLADKTVKCWGRNDNGQLGDGSTTDRYAPVASTLDLSLPTFVSASLLSDGTSVVLTFSESLSTTTATASAFEVEADGETVTVNSVSISGSTLTLTLADAVGSSPSVTVKYTAPTPSSSSTNAAVQDLAGNDAAGIPTTSVTNGSTSDTARPTATWTAPSSPSSTRTLSYTLAFNEPVVGIAGGDFSNTGTATGCTFTPALSRASNSVTVSVACSSDGTVVARLAANSVRDLSFSTGPSSAVSAASVMIDTTPPPTTTPATLVAGVENAADGTNPPASASLTGAQNSASKKPRTTQLNPRTVTPSAESTTTTIVQGRTSTTLPGLPEVDLPEQSEGPAGLLVNGEEVRTTVTREDNDIIVSAGSLKARLWAVSASGGKIPLDTNGRLNMEQGDSVSVEITGFTPGTDVEARMYSDPVLLGRTKVDPQGELSGSYEIPANTPGGEHRIVLLGDSDGLSVTLALDFVLGGKSDGLGIIAWLVSVPLGLAVVVGLLLPVAIRRRRNDESIAP